MRENSVAIHHPDNYAPPREDGAIQLRSSSQFTG